MINIEQITDQLLEEFGFEPSPLQIELIRELDRNGAQTREELVHALDSHRTTVYDNLTKLQNVNLIKKFSRPRNTRGRPLVFWKLGVLDKK